MQFIACICSLAVMLGGAFGHQRQQDLLEPLVGKGEGCKHVHMCQRVHTNVIVRVHRDFLTVVITVSRTKSLHLLRFCKVVSVATCFRGQNPLQQGDARHFQQARCGERSRHCLGPASRSTVCRADDGGLAQSSQTDVAAALSLSMVQVSRTSAVLLKKTILVAASGHALPAYTNEFQRRRWSSTELLI